MSIKRGIVLLLAACLLFCGLFLFGSCGQPAASRENIVILFTNDVHCGETGGIGYAGLAACKKAMQAQNRYVTLVDCGDFSQGDYYSAVSKGASSVERMNAVGYDYVAIGNHEFDFGTEALAENLRNLNAKAVCCNLRYTGKGENPFGDVKAYEIAEYGNVKVGFVGVTTPGSISTSTPDIFREDGEIAYGFCGEENGAALYRAVQGAIDACREDGADYVILLSHLGTDEDADAPYTSLDVIANVTGADAVLDAHSHTTIPCSVQKDKDGKNVLLSSTGTKLKNVGQLVITPGGMITVGLIGDYPDRDEEAEASIRAILAKYDVDGLDRVVASLPFAFSCNDENGMRLVRNRETAIGDLIADAYRWCGKSDIGMINGGGIRADLPAGEVTYRDVMAVNPNGNMLCVAKVKGAELLDMLEYFYRRTQAQTEKDGIAYGEEGSFQQISGMRVVIDTSVPSSVVTDETDTLLSVGETRRVKKVEVLQNGEYVPLDPEKVYTVTSHNYMLKNGGSGMRKYMADHEFVLDEFIVDYQALIDYIVHLGGDFSAYTETGDRVIVE